MNLVERFVNYTKFDTQSSEDSQTVPSTSKQLIFAKYLKEELEREGLADVEMDENGYIYATLKSNSKKNIPTIGFISHYDTSPDCSGANVNPRIVTNYDGGDIVLSEGIISSPSKFPELLAHKGEDLIVTDGHTLLGADDKAGIAEIVQAMVYLQQHPEIEHGDIRVGFNPDEEIGMGAHYFDVEKFGCEWAYTMDGGDLGELEYENFNAAGAKVTFHGRSVHPGDAKNKMVNALLLAMEFQNMLPVFENPMYTEKYEGFYHLDLLSGSVEKAQAEYIIRDHDKDKFEQKKETFLRIGAYLNEKYGKDTVQIDMKDSYYNMREIIEQHMQLIENAKAAMEETGVNPIVVPIRGGTDGARLSYMGLPCPNLCTGGHNFHGRFEYICADSMEKIVEILLKLAMKK